MLSIICAEIRNYFTYDEDKHIGDFSITDGVITPAIAIPTDYIRIAGSRKNDGVHKVSANDLVDESEFHGSVWVMSIPKDFLDLVDEIEAWQAKYGGIDSELMSPFISESFGGYSYTKNASSSGSGSDGGTTWQSTFSTRLNIWRKARIT